ncbi:MAG: type IV secretion system protein [Janthinobacterium lividum]
MIAPIGSFLTYIDGVLSGSMDSIIASMTSAMAAPVAAAAVCYYGVQGLKLANGDASPLQNFVPQLIRIGMVIYLSSNLDGFNQWVRAIFFTGLPNALSGVVQNLPESGDTGVRKRRPVRAGLQREQRPVGEAVSLPGSHSPGLELAQAEQGQPVRMGVAGQQLAWALAPARGVAAAQEAAVVEEEAQQAWFETGSHAKPGWRCRDG